MSSVVAELAEQAAANVSGIDHFMTFSGHRERLTSLACAGVPEGSTRRLCVLGAGNCNDLDLDQLAQRYAEIHLVDIDASALARAVERQQARTQAKLVCHAPVDLSGMVERLERWKAFRVTPDELIAHPDVVSQSLVGATSGPFDTVLSACVLTQMQLLVLRVFGDTHRLFEAARHTLTLTHLRTLARLVAPGGRGLLATDVTSDHIAALGSAVTGEDLKPLLTRLIASGQIFGVAHPAQFAFIVRDDPMLRRTLTVSQPVDVWRWQNGPDTEYLVYALELERLAEVKLHGEAPPGVATSQALPRKEPP